MMFEQFYLGCLAHASYLIGSNGEAAVVDPQRDVDQYIARAEAAGLRIKYVIETHLHADFVSGHIELAKRTGAEIVFGVRAGATFPHRAVRDGDVLRVGDVELKILETPGHTPEGICIVVTDRANPAAPEKILTGDTLFIGDVGRPDLVGSKGFTSQQMAGMLYDSLHAKVLALPDSVEVFPAHGAGSMCGKNLSSERSSTIGEQKRTNYALKPMAREDFITMMTTDLPDVPTYFPRDAELNRTGAAPLAELPSPTALSPEEFDAHRNTGCLVLDVRPSAEYCTAHVPGSLNIGLGGQFASWAGTLIPLETKVLLVASGAEQMTEAATRLARVGMESVVGYLDGGIAAWSGTGRETAAIEQWTVDELSARLNANPDLRVLDVRRADEYAGGHVPGAINVPLANLEKNLDQVAPGSPLAVICAGGYRSSAAVGILERREFTNLCNIVGGTAAWLNAGHQVER